jgi:hypothetical protein
MIFSGASLVSTSGAVVAGAASVDSAAAVGAGSVAAGAPQAVNRNERINVNGNATGRSFLNMTISFGSKLADPQAT